MKFMLEFPARGYSLFSKSRPEDLREALRLLSGAMSEGTIDCAYSKVGGGGYAVVNADDIASLRMMLRRLNVNDVDVHPISNTTEVIQGYLDYHESGAHEEFTKQAGARGERAMSGYQKK